jgi:hypothetical protein
MKGSKKVKIMEKITKAQKYAMIEEILGNVDGDNIDMLIEFVRGEQAALARKATKAKEKAAEKKTEIDELGNAVLGVLTADPMTRDDVFALVEDFSADVSIAKVGARLTKLVEAGSVVKSEVKAVTASGKKTTRMAYALALTDAEPCSED